MSEGRTGAFCSPLATYEFSHCDLRFWPPSSRSSFAFRQLSPKLLSEQLRSLLLALRSDRMRSEQKSSLDNIPCWHRRSRPDFSRRRRTGSRRFRSQVERSSRRRTCRLLWALSLRLCGRAFVVHWNISSLPSLEQQLFQPPSQTRTFPHATS